MLAKRLPSLDILRAVATLAVMMFHYPREAGESVFGPLGKYGWLGVDLFFVLSGYLIANKLFESIKSKGSFSVKLFYLHRAFRTIPAFLVVLFFYFLFPWFREQPGLEPLWKFLTFTQNFNLWQRGFSHAWSLCIEEQFYLVFPLAVLLFRKSFRTWQTIVFVVSVVIAGILLRSWLWQTFLAQDPNRIGLYLNVIYYPTWNRLDGLLLGVSVAALSNFSVEVWQRLNGQKNALLFLGLATFAGALFLFSDSFSWAATTFGYPLAAIAFALMVASAVMPGSILTKLRVPGSGWLAVISYSIYLLHQSIFHLSVSATKHYFGLSASDPLTVIAGFTLTIISALILYLSIEKPFMEMRKYLR